MKTIKILLLLCLGLISRFSMAQQEGSDWIYCVITDEYNNAAYFTSVFKGSYDNIEQYESAFTELIISKYGEEIDPGVHCTFEEDKAAIEDEFAQDVADNKDFYENVLTFDLKTQQL